MSKIELKDLTPKERQELLKELARKESEEKKLRKKKYDSYKADVDKTVMAIFPVLRKVSDELQKAKQLVYDKTKKLVELKTSIYETRADNLSHAFTNAEGDITVTIGYRRIDGWDDTVNEGIKLVKDYISKIKSSAGESENIKLLKDMVDRLLSNDAQGNLKASRVLELRKVAENIKDKKLHQGLEIIENAYKPKRTKNFVSVTFLDAEGKQQTLPLSITDAEIAIS